MPLDESDIRDHGVREIVWEEIWERVVKGLHHEVCKLPRELQASISVKDVASEA